MTRMTTLFLYLLMSASALAANHTKDEQAIQKNLTEFATAWNAHDATKMAAIWAEDGTVVNPVGRWAKGRTQVQQLFTEEHNTNLKGTTFAWETPTFRWVKPDVAFVDVMANISGMKTPDGKALPGKHHVAFLTMKKNNHWWNLDARAYLYVPGPGKEMTN